MSSDLALNIHLNEVLSRLSLLAQRRILTWSERSPLSAATCLPVQDPDPCSTFHLRRLAAILFCFLLYAHFGPSKLCLHLPRLRLISPNRHTLQVLGDKIRSTRPGHLTVRARHLHRHLHLAAPRNGFQIDMHASLSRRCAHGVASADIQARCARRRPRCRSTGNSQYNGRLLHVTAFVSGSEACVGVFGKHERWTASGFSQCEVHATAITVDGFVLGVACALRFQKHSGEASRGTPELLRSSRVSEGTDAGCPAQGTRAVLTLWLGRLRSFSASARVRSLLPDRQW